MINRDQAARILKDYGQEHILKYFDELSDNEKQELLSQIEIIDFSVLDNLDDILLSVMVHPVDHITVRRAPDGGDARTHVHVERLVVVASAHFAPPSVAVDNIHDA